MIVTSCPKRVMIARNQLTVVMWAPCPWSHPAGKECNVITKRIPIVLGHFVNRTVLHITRSIEMINHIYSCQIIAANGVVFHVWISVPPCFPSHRVHGKTVPVDCFTICRESTQESTCPELCAKPVGMWNRPKTGWPFLPKRRFKYNVSNTSCHVYNKDGDINQVS